VYFIVKRNELWKTDGTAAGTVKVKVFTSPILYHYIDGLTDVNGTLYFVFNKGNYQYELWKSNGTEEGTVALKAFVGNDESCSGCHLGISDMINANGVLYFVGHDATHGLELWKSNGTTEGTVLVKDIWTGSSSSSPAYLAYWNGNVYFGAKDGSMAERELWKSDGTAEGTVLIKDSAPSNPKCFTVSKGMLFFIAESDPSKPNHHSLWKTDGTRWYSSGYSFDIITIHSSKSWDAKRHKWNPVF
jgi:ELWxxDGT repeat protein